MKKLNGDGEENDDVQLYFTLHLFIHRLIEVRVQDFVAAAMVTPGGTLCLAPTGNPLWSLLKGRFETVFAWFWFKARKVLDCFCPAQD